MSDSELYYDHPDSPPLRARSPRAETAPTPTGSASGRPNVPQRSSTLGSSYEHDRRRSPPALGPSARSDDLNHGGPRSPAATPPSFAPYANQNSTQDPALLGAGARRAMSPTPMDGEGSQPPKRQSIDSASSPSISRANSTDATSTNTHTSSTTVSGSTCAACGKSMQGAFVRALGTVFHLNCFKCMDCGTVVASKFFPIDGPDGKPWPLCERDYFRRLNLICAKCDQALRGSYITACNKKFHVEHFTCSLCQTLFGPQDSYYEHDGDVYCHYHYSTRFATKCAGCSSAILKQFVEINRNNRDECWHPECYMINKFWNVKLVSRRSVIGTITDGRAPEPAYADEERRETAQTLRDRQIRMEQQVYRIWTVLSAYEESSAACISDMLRQVSNGQYLEAIRMAEKFILHVEVLFATIDDLEYHFSRLQLKGMSHVREARMLCRKTVDLFTLLSHTNETGARRMGMTQELLALVTGLAHYLKILIRIALTGALRLEREHAIREAVGSFLDKLHLLAVQGGNPGVPRLLRNGPQGQQATPQSSDATGSSGPNAATQGVTYGFRSLCPENAGDSPFWVREAGSAGSRSPVPVPSRPSDLCAKCEQTIEEDCVRLGTYRRWHSHCLTCQQCGRAAAPPPPPREKERDKEGDKEGKPDAPKLSTARRQPADVANFLFDEASVPEPGGVPGVILCSEHAHSGCRSGFQTVSRLEQYAFLLSVALRRLYVLLKNRGVVPLSPAPGSMSSGPPTTDPYRNSGDIMRMNSMHLDRKMSATARQPKRSTIIESPAGKMVQPTDMIAAQRQEVPGQQQRPSVQTAQQYQSSRIAPTQGRLPIPNGPGMDGDNTHMVRPAFARNNTGVMIVDESAPNSPSGGTEDAPHYLPAGPSISEEQSERGDGITLADIPQLMEAAQAMEEHRSLPRQSATPFVAELSPLQLAIVRHAALLILQRSQLRDQFELDDLLELVENKKNSSMWKKLFGPGKDKKNVKQKGVFGVPLELIVEREGADSMLGASRATLRVPSFIEDVISAMKQMDVSVEGIFRKAGNMRRLENLQEAIDRDPSSVDLTTDNAVQLAALLKRYLRELPDPLLTHKLHKLLAASQSLPNEEDRKRLLHMLTLLLPKPHRDTMEVLFVFLKWVAQFAHLDHETGSKMNLGNLATVICPSILRPREANSALTGSFGDIRVVTVLLENQDEYWIVPDEFMGILRDEDYFANSMELPSKEFLKKVETYMRLKAQGRNPVLMSPTVGPAHAPILNGDNRTPRNGGQHLTATQQEARAPQPGRHRQQSPSPLNMPRSPYQHDHGPATPTGQPSMDAIIAAQRQQGYANQDFEFQRPPPPGASTSSSRSSGEGPRPWMGNGSPSNNPPMQVRQRS